jgi:hypothetical protein
VPELMDRGVTVPPTSSIERRAEALAEDIKTEAKGRSVNLVGWELV